MDRSEASLNLALSECRLESQGSILPAVKSVLALVALVAITIAAFVLDVALMHAMTSLLHMNDFGKFYYSARAFLDGTGMYAPNPATDLRFVEAPELQFLNLNPPHFHLLVLPFAALQPERAVTLWLGISLFALTVSLLVISRELNVSWTPVRLLAVTAGTLAFAGTQSFFATGNLSLLLMLAMTMCWASARRGRWTAAAVWLGACLSVKPFLLIFAPYLAATRRFRALGILSATAAASVAVGLVVFGAGEYRAWYAALTQSGDWAWGVMNASLLGVFRRAFDTQPIGTPLLVAPSLVNGWIVAAALVGIVTLVVTIGHRGPNAFDAALLLLVVGAQVISPLGWIYYLWLPAGPVAAVMASSAVKCRATLHIALVLIAPIGFAYPMPFLLAFRNHAWATLTIASIYFWATLALWLLLIDDGR